MKKIFTKNWFFMMLVLALGAIVPARAQTYTSKVLGTNLGISAICKDAAGNVYTVQTVSTAQNATQQNAQIVKYAAGTTTPTILTGTTFQYSEYESVANYAFGLAIDGNGNIFVTTYNDYFPSDGRDVTTYGKILKMAPAGGNSYTQSTWVTGQYPSGNKIGDFGALAIDSHNNLFVDTYNDVDGKYEIVEYPSGSTTPTVIYTHIGDPELASGDHYTAFFALAFDPSDNLYAGTSFDTDNNTDGGKILQLTKASNYTTVNQVLAGGYCSALATDASGRLYASLANFVSGTGLTSSRIVKFSSDFSSNATLYTGMSHDGSYEPWGLAVPSSSMIFAGIGGGTTDGTGHLGDLAVLFSTPATAASNVTFTATTGTTTTVSWTNGNGASRAVFMKNTNTGQPAPVNGTTYTASTVFGSGTQIGATGWYCIYNGTGSTVDVTGLTQGQTYQVMAVEYNGVAGSENYLQTTGTNNPNNFTTVTPTTITSLNRVTGQYSNAASVSFAAVFGSAVTGVSASNFSVTTTGVSGVTNASIGTPTTSDNITWTVPVNTGTGDGTIQLNLANATGLSKTISTSLPFAGQSYTIDKTAPAISIGSPSASTAAGGPVTYTVTYSDANFNSSTLANANVTLNTTGTASGTANVTGSGLTRTVTISGITGDGTLGISIAAGTATDLAGNSAPAAGPSTTFAVDNTAPTLAITRSDPNPIKDNVLDYQAVFSEPVTGVTASSFVMTNSGVTTGAISVTMLDSKTYNITVATVAGTGTARLDLVAGGATDAAGNQAAAFNGGTDATYDVDQTAPSVSSIVTASANPTNATSVDFTVTFSEAVTGVDASDFTVANSGTTGNVNSVTGSGNTYTVNVSGVSGNGSLGLNLNSSGTNIVDAAGNPISGGFTTGDIYTIDNTPPTLNSGSYFSNNGYSSQYAKVGDNLTLSIGYNEVLQSLTMTIGGNPVTVTPSNGNRNWTGVYTMTSSDTEGNVPWTLSAVDLAGNIRNYTNNDFGTVLIFDKTGPAVNIAPPTVSGNAVVFNVNYSDANFNFSTLGTGDITLNTTGTATGTIGLSGSGTNYQVSITNISGQGTLGISIGANTAQDIPGNLASASSPSAVYTVSNNATLASVALSPATKLTRIPGGPDYADYIAHVISQQTSVMAKATTNDPGALITVNGVSASSGVNSAPVTLHSDTTAIAVTVTASDLSTKKTYRIVVTRNPSTNAILASLALSPEAPITTVAGPDDGDYTANVFNNINSVKVIPTPQDNSSTVTVNGVSSTPGAESAPIALNADTTAIAVTVTAGDGTTKRNYRLVVTRLASNNALLSALSLNPKATLTQVPGSDYKDFTANIVSQATTVKVIPTAADPNATITVNGVAAASGVESAPVALNVDTTAIAVTVTAANGTTKKTYRMVITRTPSNIALLSTLALDPRTSLTRVAGPNAGDFTANVTSQTTSIMVIPTAADNTATITVNGMATVSGMDSPPVTLNADTTAIAVTVTSGDGTTQKTYRVVVTRHPSNIAQLATLSLNPATTLTKVAGTDYADFTASVNNRVNTIKVTPTSKDASATLTVNGIAIASGTETAAITLNSDTTRIFTTVTAEDGTTKNSYVILVTKLTPPSNVMAYEEPKEMPITPVAINVHQNVSPNGDGRSDAMLIDGITNYPDNKLQIMSRAGNLVYEVKGYDNTTKVFDGHSNDGKLQQAGTYFYSLEYKVGNETKRKTGYIVLKY